MHTTNKQPEKNLTEILPKHAGRDVGGRISVRHQGGRHKRRYRRVDWRRSRQGMPARVLAIEYDPNRTAHIALVQYADGQRRYILAPQNLAVGDTVVADTQTPIRTGNTLKIRNIPVGTQIHNIELTPGRGGQIVRSAGSVATLLSKEEKFAQIKLPSGEIRLISIESAATVGQIGNSQWRSRPIGTAGAARRRGRRPSVRGVAQHPGSHPHGGGEGKSGIGMKSPKSPWGKRTLGKKTRNPKKHSNKYIVKDRRKK